MLKGTRNRPAGWEPAGRTGLHSQPLGVRAAHPSQRTALGSGDSVLSGTMRLQRGNTEGKSQCREQGGWPCSFHGRPPSVA